MLYSFLLDSATKLDARKLKDFKKNMEIMEGLQCSLQSMRECNEMCDISIISKEGKCYPAHRVILAASSPVFKAMVTQDFKELVTKVIIYFATKCYLH